MAGRLQVILSTIEPGGGTGAEPYTHDSDEEVVVVLAGRLDLWVGDEHYVLREGDAITFPSRLPHWNMNRGDTPVDGALLRHAAQLLRLGTGAAGSGTLRCAHMYAVIMAGGGGTRLHPLSRPERPKPFLPLLGRHSLLQADRGRPDGGSCRVTDDITVVTHRRYERLVEAQLPGSRSWPSRSRGTPPRRSPSRHARDRPAATTRSCSSSPPTRRSIRRGGCLPRRAAAGRGRISPTGAFDIEDPLSRSASRPIGPATEYGYLIP